MKFLRLLLLPGLLFFAASCDKDDDKAPSKAAQLTAVTWRESTSSLVINGVEGTQTITPANADSYKFSSDGKVVLTEANGVVTNGTWSLANNDSQITVTLSGQPQMTQEIFTLTGTSFSFGSSFTQAQVQAALSGQPVPGVPNGLITLYLLSAGGFTFPPNTPPPSNANQITSLQVRTNLVPR
jgi:hypothetical protein